MSSTNKTTNYELSQFVGTDKPAWLGDYNTDMSKIDAQMKLNADAATAAGGSATAATTAIGTLANLTTTDKTNLVAAINEVDSNADTAQGTANSASNAAVANTAAITGLSNYLNISYTTTNPTVTIANGTLDAVGTNVYCAANNTGSLGKVYGRIKFVGSGSTHTVSFATPLRPASALTINGVVFGQWTDDAPGGAQSWSNLGQNTLEIATDGTATITINQSISNRSWNLLIPACLLFAKAFADVPVPENA